jgi:adenosylcobinamide-GDP ribazoletransferase
MAQGSSLGRLVAGTVSAPWLVACGLVLVALVAAGTGGDPAPAGRLVSAAAVGLLAAELLYRRARARLGGVTGDVMGAMGETATAAVLLAAAALWP